MVYYTIFGVELHGWLISREIDQEVKLMDQAPAVVVDAFFDKCEGDLDRFKNSIKNFIVKNFADKAIEIMCSAVVQMEILKNSSDENMC